MYADRTQNHDQSIHEEYLMHDRPSPATSLIAVCSIHVAINTVQLIRLKGNNFLL